MLHKNLAMATIRASYFYYYCGEGQALISYLHHYEGLCSYSNACAVRTNFFLLLCH